MVPHLQWTREHSCIEGENSFVSGNHLTRHRHPARSTSYREAALLQINRHAVQTLTTKRPFGRPVEALSPPHIGAQRPWVCRASSGTTRINPRTILLGAKRGNRRAEMCQHECNNERCSSCRIPTGVRRITSADANASGLFAECCAGAPINQSLIVRESCFAHSESVFVLISRSTSFREPDPAFFTAISVQFAVTGAGSDRARQTHWPATAWAQMLSTQAVPTHAGNTGFRSGCCRDSDHSCRDS